MFLPVDQNKCASLNMRRMWLSPFRRAVCLHTYPVWVELSTREPVPLTFDYDATGPVQFLSALPVKGNSGREQNPSTVSSEISARPWLWPSDFRCVGTRPRVDLVPLRRDFEDSATTAVCVAATQVRRHACTHLIVTTCASASSRRDRTGSVRSPRVRPTDRRAAPSDTLQRRRKTAILIRLPGDSWSFITILQSQKIPPAHTLKTYIIPASSKTSFGQTTFSKHR